MNQLRIFAHFSWEPADPTPGPASDPLSDEVRKLIIDSVTIKAHYNHHDQYLDLCLCYHGPFLSPSCILVEWM